MRFEYIEFEMIVRHPFKFRSPKHLHGIKTNRADVKVECTDLRNCLWGHYLIVIVILL